MALSHLKSLQALELALRLGSLQAAARALWITPAAAADDPCRRTDEFSLATESRGE